MEVGWGDWSSGPPFICGSDTQVHTQDDEASQGGYLPSIDIGDDTYLGF